ncbi:uncharacterized protein [Haliotis asinina]|uniref:uncharacterized protein n=1 Tax=Haliotis asinina TaxID=109174 RepID=UPI003532514A
MLSRQLPVFSGIMLWRCVWIYGLISTPTEIKVTRGYNQNATLTAGTKVVFVCDGRRSDMGRWYKAGYKSVIADMYERSGSCNFRSKHNLPGLKLGSSDCRDHALEISSINGKHEGLWKCIIGKEKERAIYVHVVASPAETTTVTTSLSSLTTTTTTTTTSESTSHVTATAGDISSTTATTTSTVPDTDTSSVGYTIERRTQDSARPHAPSVISMTTILGGTVGCAVVVLAAVITVCCLLRSQREKHNNGSLEPACGDHRHQDDEQREEAGMVDNVLYDSYDGDVNYSRIGGVGQAAEHQVLSPSDPRALAGRSQPDSGVTDIYAIPDKQRTSTLQGESPGRSQPDSGVTDIYAIPDKQRTSTLQDLNLTVGLQTYTLSRISNEHQHCKVSPLVDLNLTVGLQTYTLSRISNEHQHCKRVRLQVIYTALCRNIKGQEEKRCHSSQRTNMLKCLSCTARYRSPRGTGSDTRVEEHCNQGTRTCPIQSSTSVDNTWDVTFQTLNCLGVFQR